jgi:hypothetical protein
MVRLPKPGKDQGTWGDILNTFLMESHNEDGTIKDSAITDASIADGSIVGTKLADGTITDDQIASGAGIAKSKLAALNIVNADIAGGAAIAKSKLAALNIADTDVASGAAIAQSKIANLVTDLAGKADAADLAAKADLTDLDAKADVADLDTKADLADLAAKADAADVAGKLDADGGVLVSDLDADSNKITGLADATLSTDGVNLGQMTTALADTETDIASVGTEITDLPTATIQDASWLTAFVANQNYIPIVQNGVAKKMPIELLKTMEMTPGTSISGTTHTWAVGQTVLACSNTGSLVITLPTFASTPGVNAPIRVMRIGTGSVTLQAGSSVVINKAASLPLTLRQQYSVAFFWPFFWTGGTTVYLAWGDLG